MLSQGDHLGFAPSTADISISNLSDYERRVSDFNKIRPERPSMAFRVTSWSDPRSARDITGPDAGDGGSRGSIHHIRDETVNRASYRDADEGSRARYETFMSPTITR